MKVAIGPVIHESSGVSQHVLGIKKYSSNEVHVLPSDSKWKFFGKNESSRLLLSYHNLLQKDRLKGYDAVHSHVDPGFMKLCLKTRSGSCKWVHTYHTL